MSRTSKRNEVLLKPQEVYLEYISDAMDNYVFVFASGSRSKKIYH